MEENYLNIHSTILSAKVHDCKNMLGACLLQVDKIMEKEPGSIKLLELSSRLHALNNEISDILYHHQIYTDGFSLNISENYIKDTVDEQVSNAIKIKNREDINFNITCDNDLEWEYDEIIIGSILRNIFLNAIQYTNKSININVTQNENSLIVKTIDDGPGIDTSRKAKGVGLILIKDLINIHSKSLETSITFNSIENVGAEVTLEIKKAK